MDMKELLEPVYDDDVERNAWPFVLGGAALVLIVAIGVFAFVGGSGGESDQAASDPDSVGVADASAEPSGESAVSGSTATTTTLDPSATQPEDALAAALQYIEIEEDPEQVEEFFSEIEKFVYFITVLRNPNEIGRYMQRHAPNTDNYEILDEGTPTADGTVIFEVDYTYNGNPAQVIWEIGMTDGKVTLFAADGR